MFLVRKGPLGKGWEERPRLQEHHLLTETLNVRSSDEELQESLGPQRSIPIASSECPGHLFDTLPVLSSFPWSLRLLNALNSEDRGLKVRFSLATIAFDRESAQML